MNDSNINTDDHFFSFHPVDEPEQTLTWTFVFDNSNATGENNSEQTLHAFDRPPLARLTSRMASSVVSDEEYSVEHSQSQDAEQDMRFLSATHETPSTDETSASTTTCTSLPKRVRQSITFDEEEDAENQQRASKRPRQEEEGEARDDEEEDTDPDEAKNSVEETLDREEIERQRIARNNLWRQSIKRSMFQPKSSE